MDLSKLKLIELKDLLSQVGVKLKSREESDLEAARKEIASIAERTGLSLKELIGASEGKSRVRKQAGKVAVQYRNPQDASQEWTGRGRQPKWIKELLASGKNLLSAKVSS